MLSANPDLLDAVLAADGAAAGQQGAAAGQQGAAAVTGAEAVEKKGGKRRKA